MKVRDIGIAISAFNADRKSNNRYASFDYCYSYFHPENSTERGDLDRAALELGFYLASWGMFRGSSFLLTKSYKHFLPVTNYIFSCPTSDWSIDSDSYTDEAIDRLIESYRKIRELLIHDSNSHLTLVTKIMLGVYANTPAFDRFFIKTFSQLYRGESSFTSFNRKSLRCLSNFYTDNQTEIDIAQRTSAVLKPREQHHDLRYTKAKIIDMYGFEKGLQSGT